MKYFRNSLQKSKCVEQCTSPQKTEEPRQWKIHWINREKGLAYPREMDGSVMNIELRENARKRLAGENRSE